jgi:hypothetical protein
MRKCLRQLMFIVLVVIPVFKKLGDKLKTNGLGVKNANN